MQWAMQYKCAYVSCIFIQNEKKTYLTKIYAKINGKFYSK